MTSSLSRSQNDILDFITDHLPEANSLSEEQRRVQLAALECLPEDASDFRYRPHNLQHVEQALELCPNLRELTLWGTLTSPVDLSQVVAKMKQPLLRLRLGNKGITALEWFSDADAKAWGNFLRNQKELQGLYINVAGLSGRLLRRLHSLPSSLQELCLSDIWTRRDHSSSLRAEHLEGILGHFKQLCSLDLSGNRRLRASILDTVVQLKELEHLDVSGCKMSCAEVVNALFPKSFLSHGRIPKLPRLKSLSIVDPSTSMADRKAFEFLRDRGGLDSLRVDGRLIPTVRNEEQWKQFIYNAMQSSFKDQPIRHIDTELFEANMDKVHEETSLPKEIPGTPFIEALKEGIAIARAMAEDGWLLDTIRANAFQRHFAQTGGEASIKAEWVYQEKFLRLKREDGQSHCIDEQTVSFMKGVHILEPKHGSRGMQVFSVRIPHDLLRRIAPQCGDWRSAQLDCLNAEKARALHYIDQQLPLQLMYTGDDLEMHISPSFKVTVDFVKSEICLSEVP